MTGNKILIIEDDEDMCAELKETLGDKNYSVTIARDGLEGNRLFEDNEYDVIILDLKMPGMDGRSLLKYIKHKLPAAKVFVVTGSPLSEGILRGESEETDCMARKSKTSAELRPEDELLALADAVMNKPFDMEEMLAKIKELLAGN